MSLAFRVTETDPRFHTVEQEIVGGGLTGTVQSIVRPEPVQQTTMESLAGVVGPSEFDGRVALIVGGSRGLGELTAKLIAAGGGHVIVTWQTGQGDAEKVAQEIRSAGYRCETLAYDARKPAVEQLADLEIGTYTRVLFCHTGHLQVSAGDVCLREIEGVPRHLCGWILAVSAGVAGSSAQVIPLLPVFSRCY